MLTWHTLSSNGVSWINIVSELEYNAAIHMCNPVLVSSPLKRFTLAKTDSRLIIGFGADRAVGRLRVLGFGSAEAVNTSSRSRVYVGHDEVKVLRIFAVARPILVVWWGV
jgi:hypothetical protein